MTRCIVPKYFLKLYIYIYIYIYIYWMIIFIKIIAPYNDFRTVIFHRAKNLPIHLKTVNYSLSYIYIYIYIYISKVGDRS